MDPLFYPSGNTWGQCVSGAAVIVTLRSSSGVIASPVNRNLANNALVREHPSFPLGGKYPEGGIEGTAPKVTSQTEKTHLSTLFSQKRFRSAFFDSFPQGEAFAACGRDGGLFYCTANRTEWAQ